MLIYFIYFIVFINSDIFVGAQDFDSSSTSEDIEKIKIIFDEIVATYRPVIEVDKNITGDELSTYQLKEEISEENPFTAFFGNPCGLDCSDEYRILNSADVCSILDSSEEEYNLAKTLLKAIGLPESCPIESGKYTASSEIDDPEIKNTIGNLCSSKNLYCSNKRFHIKLTNKNLDQMEVFDGVYNIPAIDKRNNLFC
ncbi:uncharacterized protein LOC122857346 [Aphidius gifuensis]|uniref:uncharacterized protein LOC122857346 n=1 Tax=Aphidius gifuensis TaxID=684658 RepID=UPI001CDBF902|nr:uncharacterized protein LOC122857346 [Aphidius gifuensis]